MDTLWAVVVGGVDYGDTDRIVKVLSAEHGRVAVMARRARKRFKGVLEVGTRVRLDLRRSKGRLSLVSEVVVEVMPRAARGDLVRLAQLVYGCELCSALAPEHHASPKLHRLLCAWLDALEGEIAPGLAARQGLEAKALTFAGLTPALVMCPVCGTRLEDPSRWSHEAGGGVHARCGAGSVVTADDLVRLEAIRRTALAEVVDVTPSSAGRILSDFAEYSLGHAIKSRAFLDEVEP
jgi:DNA repair protein RecO (recombination protein O)